MAYTPLTFHPRCGKNVRVTADGRKVEKSDKTIIIGLYVGLIVCVWCFEQLIREEKERRKRECAGSTFSSKWGYCNHSLKVSHSTTLPSQSPDISNTAIWLKDRKSNESVLKYGSRY